MQPFVVAELGVNWRGNIVILDRMLERCANAKLSAVKFQSLGKEFLDRHTELSWYKDSSLTEENVEWIDRLCKGYGLEWFSTPSYPEAVGFLNKYVKRWKIWHDGRFREDIIEQCLKTGKQVIISTSRPLELDTLPEMYKDPLIKYVYCIPKYPCSFGEINFDMIKLLPGYSNHCLDPLAILRAARYGAEYIEFHLSDALDQFAPDNKISMSYPQMDEFMTWLKLDYKVIQYEAK